MEVTRLERMLAFALLMALTAGIYLQTIGFEFLHVDDPAYVLENPQVREGLTRESVSWAFTSSTLGHWHPVTFLSYMADATVFGLHPSGFHLTNVVIHMLNALLLWLVLFRLTGAFVRSWLVAVLFAVHPLHVESVAWIAERKDVLSTFFALLALYFYAVYAERVRLWPYLAVIAAFALGLMSKAIIVTLPCVMLLLDFWPLRRMTYEPGSPVGDRLRCWGNLLLEKIPLFALSAGASYMTVWASVQDHAVRDTAAHSIAYRIGNACVSYGQYLTKMVVPTGLSAFYPHAGDALGTAPVVISAMALLGITVAALAGLRKYPYGIVGWLWFLGMIVPVSGLFQVGDQAMADRYTYLSLTGIFIWVVWGAGHALNLLERDRAARWATGAVAAVVICALTVVAWQHTRRWRDTITLYEHSLSVTADNTFSRQVLGHAYMVKGEPSVAAFHYETALAMTPQHPEWMNLLGYAYLELENESEAEALFKRVIELRPDHSDALNSLGIINMERGDFREAREFFQRVIALKPGYEGPLLNLGISWALDGNSLEALPVFQEAVAIDPDSVRAHYNLAMLYSTLRNHEKAVEHFDRVLELDPENEEAARRRADSVDFLAEMAEDA